MKPGKSFTDPDEAFVDRCLRGAPPRRAPEGFAELVLARLRRRAARPWWRRTFTHWPVTPRAGLIVACVASTLWTWRAAAWIAGAAEGTLRRAVGPLTALREVLHVAIAAQSSLRLFDGGLSSHWLLGGLAAVGVAYVTLFALGATAYRTLYLEP